MTQSRKTPIAVERLLHLIESPLKVDGYSDGDYYRANGTRDEQIRAQTAAVRRAQADDEVASWQITPRQLSPREMMSHLGNFV